MHLMIPEHGEEWGGTGELVAWEQSSTARSVRMEMLALHIGIAEM